MTDKNPHHDLTDSVDVKVGDQLICRVWVLPRDVHELADVLRIVVDELERVRPLSRPREMTLEEMRLAITPLPTRRVVDRDEDGRVIGMHEEPA